jgi:dCMP deaminase
VPADRLHRDELYARIAALYAQRSTCLRGHVGAVLVQDSRPVGAGYNGAASGLPECTEVGCEPLPGDDPEFDTEMLQKFGCQRAIHAEANAIAWAARKGVELFGAEMYCTHGPCYACAKLIVASGIVRFVYTKSYRAERLDLLMDTGIEVVQLGY